MDFYREPSKLLSPTSFQSVFEQVETPLLILRGEDLIVEAVNQKFLDLSETSHRVHGQRWTQAFPQLEKRGLSRLLSDVLKKGITHTEREVLAYDRKNNSRRLLNMIYQPFRDEQGRCVGILCQGQDVTEQVQARSDYQQKEELFRNESQNFRLLFHRTPEMLCVLKGPEHRFEFVNESHIKMLGFDATGLTVREAQPESTEAYHLLDKVYQTGESLEIHEIPVTVGETLRTFNVTYSPFRNKEGQVEGVMVLATDITDAVRYRDNLRQSEERLRIATEAARIGVWEWDLATNDVCGNSWFCRNVGLSGTNRMKAEEFFRKVHPDDLAMVSQKAQAALTETEDYTVEFRIRRAPGDVAWLYVRGRVVFNSKGLPLKMIGANIDVTQRKENEKVLQQAQNEAERANRLKSAFVANISHEIRTPLGAMMGFAELLRSPELSSDERSQFIDVLVRNGESLSVLIDDVLDLSKVESGHVTFQYQEFSPKSLTQEVLSLLQVKAAKKNLRIEFKSEASAPERIVSDPYRVRQILMNLIGNAIKFTAAGSVQVRLRGSLSPQGQSQAEFEISDTGLGVPEPQQNLIFERFVQGDDSITRRFGGTGIGLALSRRLARLLGGDVILKSSQKGQGSSFATFIADQASSKSPRPVPVENSKAQAARPEPQALLGLRVLVVDDAPDNQKLIWHYLTKQGAQVESAENGLIGLQKALQDQFDVILMDIQMSEIDGYTATQELRKAGYRKPIIAITAHAMSEAREKCFKSGCSAYLSKPIYSQVLVQTIVDLLQTDSANSDDPGPS
ncbi:MAG: PAS domain-containing protein [Bdellovibrionales bacterium]